MRYSTQCSVKDKQLSQTVVYSRHENYATDTQQLLRRVYCNSLHCLTTVKTTIWLNYCNLFLALSHFSLDTLMIRDTEDLTKIYFAYIHNSDILRCKICDYWPDCKREGPLFSAEFVCLCVCVSLLPFNVNRFLWNLVTRTPLWSSLAATIMVQIARRGTPRRLFENLKKNQNHIIRISKFWSIIFCVFVSCVL